MSGGAVCRAAAVVAWPVVCWVPAEFVLRTAAGHWDGAAESALLWAMAAGGIAAAHWRRRAPQSTRSASTTVRSE